MGKSPNRLLRGLLVLGLLLASLSAAYADPFTSYWLQNTGSEAAMDAHGKALERVARAGLVATLDSGPHLRDLGDALHFRGHLAEHQQAFEDAISLHTESLSVYGRSGGLAASGSWGDGTEHAQEHLFMSMFDAGMKAEQQGDRARAEHHLDSAHAFLITSGIDTSDRWQSFRIAPRYMQLSIHRAATGKQLTATGQILIQQAQRMPGQQGLVRAMPPSSGGHR
jgi:hypothetical protein